MSNGYYAIYLNEEAKSLKIYNEETKIPYHSMLMCKITVSEYDKIQEESWNNHINRISSFYDAYIGSIGY